MFYRMALMIESQPPHARFPQEKKKQLLDDIGVTAGMVNIYYFCLFFNILVSPLLALEGFRPMFFHRFALCWLHVELQGNFKHHLSAILRPLTKSNVDGITDLLTILTLRFVELNNRIREVSSTYRSLERILRDAFVHGQGKHGQEKVRLVLSNGSLLYNLQEIILAALLGYTELISFLHNC